MLSNQEQAKGTKTDTKDGGAKRKLWQALIDMGAEFKRNKNNRWTHARQPPAQTQRAEQITTQHEEEQTPKGEGRPPEIDTNLLEPQDSATGGGTNNGKATTDWQGRVNGLNQGLYLSPSDLIF